MSTDPLAYVLSCMRRAADNAYPWSLTPTEAGALVAEVERLRVLNADLRVMVDGLENAAHEERAAVVAHLRAQAEMAYDNTDAHHALWLAAEAVEHGKHRREEEP
jgi:hypothetical protein